jgi:hypothetical protein
MAMNLDGCADDLSGESIRLQPFRRGLHLMGQSLAAI